MDTAAPRASLSHLDGQSQDTWQVTRKGTAQSANKKTRLLHIFTPWRPNGKLKLWIWGQRILFQPTTLWNFALPTAAYSCLFVPTGAYILPKFAQEIDIHIISSIASISMWEWGLPISNFPISTDQNHRPWKQIKTGCSPACHGTGRQWLGRPWRCGLRVKTLYPISPKMVFVCFCDVRPRH